MDSVFEFLSDSLNLTAPSSPVSSETPVFLRKRLAQEDPLAEGQNRLVSPSSSTSGYPLTPLESQLKDIILNIYGENPSLILTGKEDTPAKKSSDHKPEEESFSSTKLDFQDSLTSNDTASINCVSIPRHLLSSVKRLSVLREDTNASQEMTSNVMDPPIFSADDLPLSLPSSFPPPQTPASSTIPQGENNQPSALRSSLLSSDATPHKSLPQSAFSPSDLPLDIKPSFSSLHSAFSVPGSLAGRKHPGYPLRVHNSNLSTSSIQQGLPLPLDIDTPGNVDSQSVKSEPVEKLADSNPSTPTPLNVFNSHLSQSSMSVNQKPEIPDHIKTTQHIHKPEEKSKSLVQSDTSPVMLEVGTSSPSASEAKLNEASKLPKESACKSSSVRPLPPLHQSDRNAFSSARKSKLSSVELPNVQKARNNSESVESEPVNTDESKVKFSHTSSSMPPVIPGYMLATQPSEANSSDLEKQLQQLMKEKAHLEGQLESVVKECQATLTDRARLQSKLSKTETQLQLVQNQAQVGKPESVQRSVSEEGTDLMVEVNRLESALRKRRQEMAVMAKEIQEQKKQAENISQELMLSKEQLEAKDAEVRDMSSTAARLKEENEEKADTIHEFSSTIANLKANMETTESAKAWLHDQLQEAIQSKLKLQEELRAARASSIAHSVRTDQLERENRLLKQQLGELQSKVLKDKAGLVSELEAIEADVLSKESTYAELESSKEHLEQLLELRNEEMKKLESNAVQQQARLADLESKLADNNRSIELFASQIQKMEDENKKLNGVVQHQKHTVENKDRELGELKKAKVSLQQRLQQAEATLITKEGTLQGLKDSREFIRQELEGVKAAREISDAELATAQKNLGELESQLELAETKVKQSAAELLQARCKLHSNQETIDSMKSQLLSKEKELDEKKSELVNLEDQSADLVDQFQSIQSQFHSITDESGAGMAEKDRVINNLIKEKDSQEKELDGLKLECTQLKSSFNQLEVKNAHLQGELDTLVATGPKVEDFKRILQEKNSIESQLGSEKIRHQQEMIKSQAKIARLETELNDSRRDGKRKEKVLREELDALKRDMETRESPAQHDRKVSEDALREISALQFELDVKEKDIHSLNNQQAILEEENLNLKEQLEEELARSAEVKRASDVLALQVKQSALEKERELKEERQALFVENERLKGRLAGTHTAQMCLREHANALENSLAQKEAQITQLSSKNASLLSEKEMEIEELKCRTENLQDCVANLKAELEKVLTDSLLEKQKADDLERNLREKEAELSSTQAAHIGKERRDLMEQLEELEEQNKDLQAEMRTVKQQLGISQSSLSSTKRELQDKAALADILEKNLQLAQNQLSQAQEELSLMKSHLQSTEERHQQEVEALRQMLPTAAQQINQNVDVTDNADMYDEVLSVSSTDETFTHLQDENSLYKAQLQEVQGRLAKARKEGQEAAEKKSVGEIKSLRTQLGAKSKTLKTLQDCVSSLKDDMNSMQSQMIIHSSSLAHSYRSSREIENKIEGLQRNQSGSVSPYPVASTPTK